MFIVVGNGLSKCFYLSIEILMTDRGLRFADVLKVYYVILCLNKLIFVFFFSVN